ncbi:MAG TPA: alpha-2-macroglobulin family protein, partial [Pyrinomonadaceae bacterium]|nr:alpha-2-macroglobulin family protein [Pyrinomonadaceae bacterium]
QASPLSESETQRLLARLPTIKPGPGDVEGFRLRENSLPPPRAGEIMQAAFAPPSLDAPQPQTKTTAPLAVLRHAPEGEVALAPALSITFSQPMIAVASQGEAAASVPVTLTPQPKGSWRWLGTQTLVFQPEAEGGRLPMATAYAVTVPAGTKSALGNTLPESKSFNFATPPPVLKRSHPSDQGQPRDALMFLEFDQRIDAASVLEKLKLQPAASGLLRLRLATPEEIAADETVKEMVKRANEGRWLALRAVTPDNSTKDALPADTEIRIIIPPGMPSAEGPRATTSEQSFVFKTHGPLRVTGTECGYDKRCSPFDQLQIVFSNRLDFGTLPAAKATITPEIPGMSVSASGNSLLIQGTKRSNTTYTVTLNPSIKDVYGQTLTGDNRVTFKVTTAEPRLFSTSEDFVVLDPAGRRIFNVYSVNYRRLKVRLYKVTPDDWGRFRFYQVAVRHQKEKAEPPGTLVFDEIVDLKSNADEMTETAINLSPALTNGRGQVFVQVEPVEEKDAPVRVYPIPGVGRVGAWVQATEIGLDAFVGQDGPVVWANSLRDGSPLTGVEVSVVPENARGVTGADGLARINLRESVVKGESKPALVVARRGDDVAILPNYYSDYYFSDVNNNISWLGMNGGSTRGWYVFDDRNLYRPGEEVSVKGWIRNIVLTPTGDTEMIDLDGEAIVYTLQDALGNEIKKGTVPLNALAGFDLKLRLPATMNLGEAELEIELERTGSSYTHRFQVQEFRRPEFEIKATASEAPHFVGSSATVAAAATYYTGGGLANTEVNWTVISQPTNYTPPNRDDYTFGKFHPWWGNYVDDDKANEQTFKGKTDAQGKHVLRIDFDGVNPPGPSHVRADAVVQDVNRQTLSASAELLVHPADVYVGLKSARTFVQRGDPFDLTAIVTDLDGRALAGRDVKLRLVRLDYVYEDGEWRQKERDAREQTIKSGADGVSVRLATEAGGAYRLTARVLDARERPNESELMLWVAGGKLPPVREVRQEKVELIPSRKTYSGGEVAEVLVQSPFAPAEGILTLRRSGLLKTERFTMTESSYTLRVPLEEAMTPNLHVQVDLVGAQPRADDAGNARADLPRRPAFASGEINLSIPPVARRLKVRATPRDQVLEPGAETFVDVLVEDARGAGVSGTDTAVVVVDEAVLALADYKLSDPLDQFYPLREENVEDRHLRQQLKLASPEEVADAALVVGERGRQTMHTRIMELPRTDSPFERLTLLAGLSTVEVTASAAAVEVVTKPWAEEESPIKLRKNFNALAVFAASVPTDASGRAQVKIKVPDNLTRYRVMAVTVAGGKQAGAGESVITARKRLMVRPSAPRFFNFGDRAELPVVLQNQTDESLSVNVAVRATNAELTAGAGRNVVVPANNRVEVRFPVAARLPGTARFQVVTSSGRATDAAKTASALKF